MLTSVALSHCGDAIDEVFVQEGAVGALVSLQETRLSLNTTSLNHAHGATYWSLQQCISYML